MQRFAFQELPNSSEINVSQVKFNDRVAYQRWHVPALERMSGGASKDTVLKLVPYYAWNNRGAGSMIVWMERIQSPTLGLLPREPR